MNTYTYTYVNGVTSENYIYVLNGNGFRNEYKYDANGNVIEEKSYNTTPANPAGTYSGTITYGNYDNKNNPNTSLPFPSPYKAKNNVGMITYSSTDIETYIYEYNIDGYPTKRTAGTQITTYEYRRL